MAIRGKAIVPLNTIFKAFSRLATIALQSSVTVHAVNISDTILTTDYCK